MHRFQYWRDPACLVCCAAYMLNRYGLKALFHSGFFHGYFNDLLLIPCALPFLLLLQRHLGLRLDDSYPGASEITMHVLVWSILFEWIGPQWMHWTVADPMDVVAYGVGAILAGVWWGFARNSCRLERNYR